MRRRPSSRVLAAIAAALTVISVTSPASQSLRAAQAPAGAPAAAVRSPEVSADRRVTFRLSAPRATTVSVVFDEGTVQTFPMTRNDAGIWSVTVGPVAPELYVYHFIVDGLRVLDLQNTTLKSGLTLSANLVEVPGTPPRFDEVQLVPHGSMVMHTYRSSVQGADRGLYVYLPAEYNTSATKHYPVLYLYHGGGGMEADWARDGRTGVILDNLIAQGRALPMIVVMPNNNAAAPSGRGRSAGAAPVLGPPASAASLGRELMTEIIPLIERQYRVQVDREHRAIAGLSAGGGTAFTVGMGNVDTFATVAEFSSGMFGGSGAAGANPAVAVSPDVIVPGLFANAAATSKRLTLLYMSCGTEDPRLPFQQQTFESLKQHGFSPVFVPFAGAHQWKVWRHSLNDLAPRLFR